MPVESGSVEIFGELAVIEIDNSQLMKGFEAQFPECFHKPAVCLKSLHGYRFAVGSKFYLIKLTASNQTVPLALL